MYFLLLLAGYLIAQVGGHARLVQPPSRASMWRYGYDTPKDYEDNEGFCGGIAVQWEVNEGRCGLCGDPYNGAREHEVGGQFATGEIVATYRPGQEVQVTVEVTANHGGHFRFSVCPASRSRDPTQECLDANLLTVLQSDSSAFPLTDRRTGRHNLTVKLPPDLTCSHCVLQWTWTCANNWGLCGSTGRGAVGCGPQETFRACADIAILRQRGGSSYNTYIEKDVVRLEKGNKPGYTEIKRQQGGFNYNQIITNTEKNIVRPEKVVKAADKVPLEDVIRGRKICVGSGLYRGLAGMERWCGANCNNSPSYCPASHCQCYQ